MATPITTFKKIMLDLDVSGTSQYSLTNDLSNNNTCFLNFNLMTNITTQNVTITFEQYTSQGGSLENSETFILNYKNNTLSRNINIITAYTLITITNNSFNGILSGFIEKLIIGDNISIDVSGQTVAVRGGVDISGQRVVTDISGQSMYILSTDVSSNQIIQVKSTPDYNANIGLNTYRIMPKMKTFTISGKGADSTANALWTNSASTILVTDYNWGRDVSGGIGKKMYATSGGTSRTINYTYVDASGIEANGSAVNVPVGSWVDLSQNNIVGINKIWTSTNPISGDNYYIAVAQSGAKAIAHISGITDTYCGIYTCPNNARAFVSLISVATSTQGEYLRIVHWTASGIRTIRNTFWCSTSLNNVFTGGSELGSLSGWIEAGEAVSLMGTVSTTTNKLAYMIVNVYYY